MKKRNEIKDGHRANCACKECCIRRALLLYRDKFHGIPPVALSPEAVAIRQQMRAEGAL